MTTYNQRRLWSFVIVNQRPLGASHEKAENQPKRPIQERGTNATSTENRSLFARAFDMPRMEYGEFELAVDCLVEILVQKYKQIVSEIMLSSLIFVQVPMRHSSHFYCNTNVCLFHTKHGNKLN